jgi:hypothetical protein
MLDHIGAQVVTDKIRIPAGGGHEPLHAIRGALAGVLSQLPAVLPRHVAQQAAQVSQRTPTRLGADKPLRDPGMQGVQPCRPRLDFLDGCPLVDLQHGSSRPPSRCRLPAHPRPGGQERYPIKASAAGVLG